MPIPRQMAPTLGAGYVVCDELGRPYAPDRLRRVWYRLMRGARSQDL
jgi:hypothetical protein